MKKHEPLKKEDPEEFTGCLDPWDYWGIPASYDPSKHPQGFINTPEFKSLYS